MRTEPRSALYPGVLPRPAVPAQPHHAEQCLAEDASAHLRRAFTPVYKYHRNLLYPETDFIGCEFHFNLKSIAFESDFVKLDCLQHAPFIAFEARCGVVDSRGA